VTRVRSAVTVMHLSALFRSAPPGSLIELRYRGEQGLRSNLLAVEHLAGAIQAIQVLTSRTDVYIGALARTRSGSGVELVRRASVAWADCDSRDSVALLAAFRPAPAIEIASGSSHSRHAYWLLRDPVGIDALWRLNHRLALTLGAAPSAADPRWMSRPAGSLNHRERPAATVRLLRRQPSARVTLTQLDYSLVDDPVHLAAAADGGEQRLERELIGRLRGRESPRAA
jgi:hypothetical protein